jgi:hypothetical protein
MILGYRIELHRRFLMAMLQVVETACKYARINFLEYYAELFDFKTIPPTASITSYNGVSSFAGPLASAISAGHLPVCVFSFFLSPGYIFALRYIALP